MRHARLILLALAGCTSFPALDGTISDAAREAPYPILTPLPADLADPTVPELDLTTRIAALQARAARLRQTDIGALQ